MIAAQAFLVALGLILCILTVYKIAEGSQRPTYYDWLVLFVAVLFILTGLRS